MLRTKEMIFAVNLESCLIIKGMTKKRLADLLYLPATSIQRWLSGTAIPGPENLTKISEIFGVTEHFLTTNLPHGPYDIPPIKPAERIVFRSNGIVPKFPPQPVTIDLNLYNDLVAENAFINFQIEHIEKEYQAVAKELEDLKKTLNL